MPEKETITLKDAVESYLIHLSDSGTKETSVKVYERALELAITHFGTERKLSGILIPHVSKFFSSDLVNKHGDGRPKAVPTIKQNKRVFRQCLDFAKSKKWIASLPIPKNEMQHARGKKTSLERQTSEAKHVKKISKEVKSTDK